MKVDERDVVRMAWFLHCQREPHVYGSIHENDNCNCLGATEQDRRDARRILAELGGEKT